MSKTYSFPKDYKLPADSLVGTPYIKPQAENPRLGEVKMIFTERSFRFEQPIRFEFTVEPGDWDKLSQQARDNAVRDMQQRLDEWLLRHLSEPSV